MKTRLEGLGQLNQTLASIEGWLTLEEAWALHEAARTVRTAGETLTIVEVGSWKGRSTVAIALGVRARGRGKLYAIDPHTGSRQTKEITGPLDTYEAFLQNVERACVREYVEPLRTVAHLARERFHDRSVELLYLDAEREFYEVLEYFDDWSSALAERATVVIKSPADPSILPVLKKRVFCSHSPFWRMRHVGDLLFLDFWPDRPWNLYEVITLFAQYAQLKIQQIWQQGHLAWQSQRVIWRFRFRRLRSALPTWLP